MQQDSGPRIECAGLHRLRSRQHIETIYAAKRHMSAKNVGQKMRAWGAAALPGRGNGSTRRDVIVPPHRTYISTKA